MSAATYKLSVTVTKDGDWYTVSVECNGFAGEVMSVSIEYAFKGAYDECMARLAEGTKP